MTFLWFSVAPIIDNQVFSNTVIYEDESQPENLEYAQPVSTNAVNISFIASPVRN